MTDPTALNKWAIRQAVAAEQLEGWNPTPAELAVLVSECDQQDPLPALLAACSPQSRTEKNVARRGFSALRNRVERNPPYLVPGSATLRNKLGIDDFEALQRAEFIVTAIRLVQFHRTASAIRPPGVRQLLTLHEHIFGDLYSWAGCIRNVNLSKNVTSFTPVPQIWSELTRIDHLIVGTPWSELDHGDASYIVSRVYAELNQAHPFREGNGRAGTTLLHELVSRTSFRLDLSTTDRAEWIAASRDSAPFRSNGVASPRPFLPAFRRALQPRQG